MACKLLDIEFRTADKVDNRKFVVLCGLQIIRRLGVIWCPASLLGIIRSSQMGAVEFSTLDTSVRRRDGQRMSLGKGEEDGRGKFAEVFARPDDSSECGNEIGRVVDQGPLKEGSSEIYKEGCGGAEFVWGRFVEPLGEVGRKEGGIGDECFEGGFLKGHVESFRVEIICFLGGRKVIQIILVADDGYLRA